MLVERKANYCNFIEYILIVGLLYFFGAGIENCVWVKKYTLCKSLGNIIVDISIILLASFISYAYGKKIKYKKTKIFVGLFICIISNMISRISFFKKIRFQYNYIIFVVLCGSLIIINTGYLFIKNKQDNK